MSLRDVRLHGNRDLGLAISGAGSGVVARRLVVDGTRPSESSGAFGWGVGVASGATLDLHGARLSRNHEAGLTATDADTVVIATNLLVNDTAMSAQVNPLGRGVIAQLGARMTLVGANVLGNHDVGVLAAASLPIELVGVAVRATQAHKQGFGVGLLLTGIEGQSSVRSCRLIDNSSAALSVHRSEVALDNCVLAATRSADYPLFAANGARTGEVAALADGLVVDVAKSVVVRRCVIAGNPRAAVLLRDAAAATVVNTLLTASQIGLAQIGGQPCTITASLLHGNATNTASAAALAVAPAPKIVSSFKPGG